MNDIDTTMLVLKFGTSEGVKAAWLKRQRTGPTRPQRLARVQANQEAANQRRKESIKQIPKKVVTAPVKGAKLAAKVATTQTMGRPGFHERLLKAYEWSEGSGEHVLHRVEIAAGVLEVLREAWQKITSGE